MERLRQSLADAARDDTKKNEEAARALRTRMVEERGREMRAEYGMGVGFECCQHR